ncbi:MAG TPA: CHRD domain-containing protein [Candidatus Binatia bacterium]|nr:CHRD domain-containing protein [Candidatus Binatia bacterium]
MKLFLRSALLLSVFLAIAVGVAQAETIQATLTGYDEVPSVSTVGEGEFRGFIGRNDASIDYELSYSDLQGQVRQAHIHVAQLSVNGSIVIWLCGTTTNPGPTGTQTCPQNGTITGTIGTGNVIAGSMGGQQLTANDLAEVIRAIRAGATYVNVHTDLSTGGEIRGQIRASARK